MTFNEAMAALAADKSVRRAQWMPGMVASFINPWAGVRISPACMFWHDDRGMPKSCDFTLMHDGMAATDWEIVP